MLTSLEGKLLPTSAIEAKGAAVERVESEYPVSAVSVLDEAELCSVNV